ncbi:hypothetical protein GDO86_013368 [Hymenochirus boettgeri]|uniref:Uncharacterized protein n=1 Tax=Hymenochirus boettgeri TaxID=247094 RepID=A0A8T2IZ23_9PIPI|nr:hypothetical protein GDO86_013368 [Hymenochirus boettgeri]
MHFNLVKQLHVLRSFMSKKMIRPYWYKKKQKTRVFAHQDNLSQPGSSTFPLRKLNRWEKQTNSHIRTPSMVLFYFLVSSTDSLFILFYYFFFWLSVFSVSSTFGPRSTVTYNFC